MEKRTNFYDFIDKIQRQDRYIEELEEENKKLKEEIENHKQNIMQDELEIIPKLEEANKKLKEKVRFLEECLDRKEKLNESYRKEIKDHQLYEEKLEHRIIEFEELLHGE